MRKLLSKESGDFSIRNQFLTTLMVAFLFVVYVTSGTTVTTASQQKDFAQAVSKTGKNYTLSLDIQENSNPRISVLLKTENNKVARIHTTEKTVKDALIQAKVKLTKDNIVTPALDSELKNNSTIVITKKEPPKKVEETPEEEIAVPASTQQAEPEAKETPKKEAPKKEKPPVLAGTGSVLSPLNYSKNQQQPTNELPKNATLYKRGATATAYTANSGALTASGKPAQIGYVAVDPSKIAYGTKLYICSENGKFIYGYALAADTGSALHSGEADVDLFLNSYDACISFGRRHDISIYIVK